MEELSGWKTLLHFSGLFLCLAPSFVCCTSSRLLVSDIVLTLTWRDVRLSLKMAAQWERSNEPVAQWIGDVFGIHITRHFPWFNPEILHILRENTLSLWLNRTLLQLQRENNNITRHKHKQLIPGGERWPQVSWRQFKHNRARKVLYSPKYPRAS